MTPLDRAARWADIDRLARRQYGLVTAVQLRRIGVSTKSREWLIKTRRLMVARRGVYRLCGVAPSWRSTALAVVLAAGPDAVLSHLSAGALWDLFEEQDLEGRLEIIAGDQVRLQGARAHRSRLLPGDGTRRHGIPVTSIERTLLDLSEVEPAAAIGRLLDQSVRRRLTTVGQTARVVDAHRRTGRRRFSTISQVLADRGVDFQPGANDWEQEMDRMWDRMGLPAAQRQYTITLPNGRKYRPDRVIVHARITADWNGYLWHGMRSDFEHDIERRNALIAAGWTPLEFHSNQSPAQICRTVMGTYDRIMSTSLPAS